VSCMPDSLQQSQSNLQHTCSSIAAELSDTLLRTSGVQTNKQKRSAVRHKGSEAVERSIAPLTLLVELHFGPVKASCILSRDAAWPQTSESEH